MAERLGSKLRFGKVSACKRILRANPPSIIATILDGRNAVHEAVLCKQDEILAELLANGVGLDLEARDQQSNSTAVMLAMKSLSFRCYQLLATAGADLLPQTEDTSMALLCAVAAGDMRRVEELLALLNTLDAVAPIRLKILIVAAAAGRADMLRFLLSHEFSAGKQAHRFKGWTIAMYAVQGGHIDCLDLLRDNSLSAQNWHEENVLHIAAQCGHAAMLRHLVTFDELIPLLNATDKNGLAPLGHAIQKGSVACLEVLCEAGADLRAVSRQSLGTALHLAAEFDRAAMLSRFLSQHIFDGDLNRENEGGYTALATAITAESVSCYQVLRAAGADPTIKTEREWNAFHLAAQQGDDEMLHLLLEDSMLLPQVDEVDALGRSPLAVAVMCETVTCSRLLLLAGADRYARCKRGMTAVHYATEGNSRELFDLLFQQGTEDLNAQTHAGRTALMLAAEFDRIESIQVLLASGADSSLRDDVGRTVLHYAVSRESPRVLEALRASSVAEINIQDEDGWTPLMCTTVSTRYEIDQAGRLNVIKLLLSHGALVHLTNKKGESAKHLAAKAGLSTFVDLLQAHEDYLANLGAHTKPALRTPVADASSLDLEAPKMISFPDAALPLQLENQQLELDFPVPEQPELAEAYALADQDQPSATTSSFVSCSKPNQRASGEDDAAWNRPAIIYADWSDLVEELTEDAPDE
eukprot:m.549260 g.549260  ORF g.549260 m.549260 type:complete len:698 (-) comp57724_c1_seq5:1847-3940(-)